MFTEIVVLRLPKRTEQQLSNRDLLWYGLSQKKLHAPFLIKKTRNYNHSRTKQRAFTYKSKFTLKNQMLSLYVPSQ